MLDYLTIEQTIDWVTQLMTAAEERSKEKEGETLRIPVASEEHKHLIYALMRRKCQARGWDLVPHKDRIDLYFKPSSGWWRREKKGADDDG